MYGTHTRIIITLVDIILSVTIYPLHKLPSANLCVTTLLLFGLKNESLVKS